VVFLAESDGEKIGNEDVGEIVPSSSEDLPEAARSAVEKIRKRAEELLDDPNKTSYLMAVDHDSAKAELVPVTTPANMEKLRAHHGQLPEKIRTNLENSMNEGVREARDTILDILERQKRLGKTKSEDGASPRA
jgi:hypothetical protein